MVLNGFYILKDDYFERMNDPNLKNNKNGNRPFFYCVKESSETLDVFWMIPLSSRIDKYERIIKAREESHRPCDGLYICKLPTGTRSAFLIQDIFPIVEKYIEREYTVGTNHLVRPYQKDVSVIAEKAKKAIRLIKNGIRFTPASPDVNRILNILITDSDKPE